MENMPLMVLLGVGVLLILIIVLFIISQKKQDKEEALQTKEMLDKLDIDLKDASEDIDDTVATAETEADDTSAAEPEHGADTGVTEKEAAAAAATAAPPETPPETAPDTGREPAGEAEPAVKTDEEADTVEAPEKESAPDEMEPEDKKESAPAVAAEEEIETGDAAPPDTEKASGDDMDIFADAETPEEDDEMSELDALFEANSDVEELVMSGKALTDEDIVKDTSHDDFFTDEETFSTEPSGTTAATEDAPPSPAPPVRDTAAMQPPETKDEDIDLEDEKTEPKPAAPAAVDPDEQKRHEKARRIARVIVNDIRNYNPENLAEGIRMGNIMKTLGKEVERGRLLYIKRVPQDITRETNYYREALIKILADGRPDLLGL